MAVYVITGNNLIHSVWETEVLADKEVRRLKSAEGLNLSSQYQVHWLVYEMEVNR